MILRKTKFLAFIVVLFCAVWLAATPVNRPQKHYGRVLTPITDVRAPQSSALDEVFVWPGDSITIPEVGQVVCTLSVPDSIVIEDLDVGLSLRHTWIRDLRITLERDTAFMDTVVAQVDSTYNPEDSTWTRDTTWTYVPVDSFVTVVLLNLFPGDSISDLTGCWFDQDAGQVIDSGVPPFTGAYRPTDTVNTLDRFVGQNAQGEWRLRVFDQFVLDSGWVDDYRLEINGVEVLRGTVTNAANGNPVANAMVSIIDTVTSDTLGRSATNSAGAYGFTRVTPGVYRVQFAASNYDSLTIEGVQIAEGVTATLDAQLTPLVSFASFPYAGSPVEIPDAGNGMVTADVVVDASETIRDLDVVVNITHPYIADLTISLAAPNGDTVTLFNPPLVPTLGANMTNCRFDDEATIAIGSGTGPFTGSYRPEGVLTRFDNRSATGTWSLHVEDFGAGDIGAIQGYILHMEFPLTDADDGPALALPESFALHPAYPNPFNPSTTLVLDVTKAQDLTLNVYDVTGRLVATLFDGRISVGSHHFHWQPLKQASGIYFVRAATFDLSQTQKLVLLK